MRNLNKRENLLAAMQRQNPDYVPWGLTLCDSQLDHLEKVAGTRDEQAFFDLSYRYLYLNPSQHPIDFTPYFEGLEKPDYISDTGVGFIRGSIAHFARMVHPMEKFDDPAQVWAFPLPDVMADYRWEGYAEKVKATKEAGLATVYFAVDVFEPAWYLRGLDLMLMDIYDENEMAVACLDRMTEYRCKMCKRLAECGVDIIVYGDDVGTQRGMMMSPEIWRKWLKPRMEKVIRAAKDVKPDLLAYYHSDGNIYDIIPELIEIGVDVLNPVQPECMDPVFLKEQYGDRLSFWGTIGTQTTMPFGSPADVEREVKKMVETVGKGGGLLLAPTHLLEPEVPWENIMAFIDSVKKYGRYI